MQKNVLGVCKHYPGKGLIRNTHVRQDKQTINQSDLDLFNTCYSSEIAGIMVGHQKASGDVLNSENRPSTVSKEVIKSIPPKLIIFSDEVNMWGLKVFYLFNKRKMYADLINSGNNVILDFKLSSSSMTRLINNLEMDVKNGEINESRINESVKKILEKKGYKIKTS